MGIKIFDIDETGFYVENPDGDDYVVAYSGEPDSDSSGTLEYEVVDYQGLDKNLHGDLLEAIKEFAPYAIYQYLKRKAENEQDDNY